MVVGALRSSGYREGLPASTGGVLSGFFPGSKGAESRGHAQGGEGGTEMYSTWIYMLLFDSVIYCLMTCN